MVIVVGTFEVDAGDRAEFLESRSDLMRASRVEAGCLEYTFAADPLDPERVVLTERWESKEHLDAHLAALRADADAGPRPLPARSSVVTIYSATEDYTL